MLSSCIDRSAPAGALDALCPAILVSDRINNCDPGCALVCRLPVSQSAHLQERCMPRTAALQPNLCCWSALQT